MGGLAAPLSPHQRSAWPTDHHVHHLEEQIQTSCPVSVVVIRCNNDAQNTLRQMAFTSRKIPTLVFWSKIGDLKAKGARNLAKDIVRQHSE